MWLPQGVATAGLGCCGTPDRVDFHRSIPSFLIWLGACHCIESALVGWAAVAAAGGGSVADGAPTSQDVSCFTFWPPQPSWEKSASRTELSCSSCLLVEPLVALVAGSEEGRPLPTAAAQEVLGWGAPEPGACGWGA